ncbi:MAG: c-type cytochrome [Gammaproteobacteria bacterium]|nr:c-type cytochrome [Gammaproteobacteria bacterium]
MALLRLRVLGVAVLGLATLSPAAHAAGDPAAGKQKATACIACHGEKGEGRSGNPRIGNLGEEKIIGALKAFKDGSRPSQTMQRFARGSHQDFADIAAYFASRN